MLGDVSGTVIPPFFVYYAELSGRHQYQLSRKEFSLWRSQGVLGQLTFRFLSMIRQDEDQFTFAQAHWAVALAMMAVGNPNLAWKHYRRAITVIRSYDIRFAPLTNTNHLGIPPITAGLIPSEEDHERVAFLAKILYLEVFLYFYVSGLPGTKVWANHNHEDKLPVWTQIAQDAPFRPDALISSVLHRVVRMGSDKTFAAFAKNLNANSNPNFR